MHRAYCVIFGILENEYSAKNEFSTKNKNLALKIGIFSASFSEKIGLALNTAILIN